MHKAEIKKGPYGTSWEVFVSKLNVAYGKARNVDKTSTINPKGIPTVIPIKKESLMSPPPSASLLNKIFPKNATASMNTNRMTPATKEDTAVSKL